MRRFRKGDGVILFWLICAARPSRWPSCCRLRCGFEESEGETDDERKQANIAVYRDQLSELEADLRNGIVSEEQYAQDRDEIERRLLEDTTTTSTKESTPAPRAYAREHYYSHL